VTGAFCFSRFTRLSQGRYGTLRSYRPIEATLRSERSPGPFEPRLLVDGHPTLRVGYFPLDVSLVTPVVPQVSAGGLPACTSIRNRVATIQSKCVLYASMKKPRRKAGAVNMLIYAVGPDGRKLVGRSERPLFAGA
jgi:hypothetical protein